MLIDPNGNVIGQKAGENIYEIVQPNIERLIEENANKLNRTVFPFRQEESLDTVLRFPAKIIAGPAGTIFLSDSGHNQILQITTEGKVLEVIGSGQIGFETGNYRQASFNEPHGLALKGDILYVADAKNNVIRLVDLVEKVVTTAAGTGELDYYFYEEKWGEPVNPNSPWD